MGRVFNLGGNGVANSTVYGGIAGEVMGADVGRSLAFREPDETVLDVEIARVAAPLSKRPASSIRSTRAPGRRFPSGSNRLCGDGFRRRTSRLASALKIATSAIR